MHLMTYNNLGPRPHTVTLANSGPACCDNPTGRRAISIRSEDGAGLQHREKTHKRDFTQFESFA